MKKLLIILICLFVSFELKSKRVSETDFEEVKMKDCLKYLDKGKILHKFEDFNTISNGITREVVVTIFSYNQKTYKHTLAFEVFKFKDSVGITKTRKTQLDFASCNMIDFDKFKED